MSTPWVSRQPATLLSMAQRQYRSAMAARHYDDIEANVLRALPNPGGAMELKHKAPEVTFLGARRSARLRNSEDERVGPRWRRSSSSRSLKEYLYQWRDTAVSYERFLDVVIRPSHAHL